MIDTVDTIVIGAGVVGLAIARTLAMDGREVVVLEKNASIGEETSSRNSEVIHAGLYYPANSLKAKLCIEGRARLYDYCAAKGIEHRRCGKVLVAIHEEQTPKLKALQVSARANGEELRWLAAQEVQELEPAIRAAAGLWSPATGIVDSHALMLALRGDLEQAGGSVAVLSRLTSGARAGAVARLVCDIDSNALQISARNVINAAGLHATRVAQSLHGLSNQDIPNTRYAKGNYFVYGGKSPFTHLVYPLPEDGGLGIHATLDLAGRARFGPDVQWLTSVDVDAIDYAVDPARAQSFYTAVRTYWPDLPNDGLNPAYSGVRPKLSGPGEPPADFMIQSSGAPGEPQLVQLFGIESPGLTASLAIGEHVRTLLG